jgi:hypothetical protein
MSSNAKALGYLLLIPAHSKFLAAFEQNQMIPVKPGMYFLDVVQVDDDGAMNPHKLLRIELGFQTGQRFANIV